MKETYYLKHDYNSRNDEKILKLRSKLGAEGFGIYWMLLEKLAESSEGRLLISDIECIAYELRLECERITDVIRTYGLFKMDEEYFWSGRLVSDLAERNCKSEKAKLSAKIRWNKKATYNKSYSTATRANKNANAMQGEERRREERKGEDRIGEEKENFSTPSQQAKDFFLSVLEKNSTHSEMVEKISKSRNLTFEQVSAEFDKFTSYWTELTADGKKQRWEVEKFFETQRRLSTWFQNVNKFSSSPIKNFRDKSQSILIIPSSKK